MVVVDPVEQEERRKKRYGRYYPQWRKLQDQLVDSNKKQSSLKQRKMRKQPKARSPLREDIGISRKKRIDSLSERARNIAYDKIERGKKMFPDILGDEPEDVTKKYTYPKSPSKETNYQTHIDKPIHWNALTGKIEREKEAEKETAMDEEEPLEELTDGELKEVEKLKAWEIWLEKTITGDANKPRPAKDDADPMGARVYQDGTLDFKRRGKYADQTIERPRKLPSNPHKTTQRGRSTSSDLTAFAIANSKIPKGIELDYLNDPKHEHKGLGSTRKEPKNQKELDDAWNKKHIMSNTGDRRKKPKKKVKKAFWETWLEGGSLWEVWLNKKDDWDKKERELDWRKRQQRARSARRTRDRSLTVHAKEEVQGTERGLKQRKDEEEAVRSGKVAPPRTPTITSTGTVKQPKDEHWTDRHILHENKALWKSWLEKKDEGKGTLQNVDEVEAVYRHATEQDKGVRDSPVVKPEELPKKGQISQNVAEKWKSWLDMKKDQGQGDARYGNPHETGFEDPRVLQTSKDDFSMQEKEEKEGDSNKPYIERKHEDDRDERRQ